MEQEELASRLAAIGNSTRLAILRTLADAGQDGVGLVALGQVHGLKHSLAHYHLQPMVAAGLLTTERNGREVAYRVAPGALEAVAEELTRLGESGAGRPR